MSAIQLYILSAMGVFFLFELWKPRVPAKLVSLHRLEDAAWYVLNEVVLIAVSGWIGYRLGLYMEKVFTGIELSADLTGFSIPAQALIFLFLFDLLSFGFHTLAHYSSFLWETHRIHHTTTELTFLSAFRHSWAEILIQHSFFALAFGWMNFSDEVRMWGNLGFVLLCMIQHLNVPVIFPDWIELIVITPKNHFWHHAKFRKKSYGQNFGLFFTFWDHLLGSYHNPEHFSAEVGLLEAANYTSFFNRMFHPFDTKLRIFFSRVLRKL